MHLKWSVAKQINCLLNLFQHLNKMPKTFATDAADETLPDYFSPSPSISICTKPIHSRIHTHTCRDPQNSFYNVKSGETGVNGE